MIASVAIILDDATQPIPATRAEIASGLGTCGATVESAIVFQNPFSPVFVMVGAKESFCGEVVAVRTVLSDGALGIVWNKSPPSKTYPAKAAKAVVESPAKIHHQFQS